MNWRSEWKAITAPAEALMMVGERLDTHEQQYNRHLNYLAVSLAGQVNQLKSSLQNFHDRYKTSIPYTASQAIQNYFGVSTGSNFERNTGATPQIKATNSLLLSMFLLISEVNFCLTNTSEIIKRQSERAFLHLQQSIAAAEDIRLRWQKAFRAGEVACEKLGAAHLLQHGIYAFKAGAEGARTDLVFEERALNIADVERTADGLVLTEWKKVQTQAEASAKAEQARKQADKYHTGILSGIELANYRYIVLVSEKQLNEVADIEENGVVYRHINIAVSPLSPSKASLL